MKTESCNKFMSLALEYANAHYNEEEVALMIERYNALYDYVGIYMSCGVVEWNVMKGSNTAWRFVVNVIDKEIMIETYSDKFTLSLQDCVYNDMLLKLADIKKEKSMEKLFTVSQVRALLNRWHDEKITFSKFVEILNKIADKGRFRVDKPYSNDYISSIKEHTPTIKTKKSLGKVFLSGKITGGRMSDCIIKYKEAEGMLQKAGFDVVINPLEVEGVNFWRDYDGSAKLCLEELAKCGNICMLTDWRESERSIKEREFAIANELNIMYVGNTKIARK